MYGAPSPDWTYYPNGYYPPQPLPQFAYDWVLHQKLDEVLVVLKEVRDAIRSGDEEVEER